MAEWSKAPANSPREQGGVGSKPAPAKKLVFALFLSFFDHSEILLFHQNSLNQPQVF